MSAFVIGNAGAAVGVGGFIRLPVRPPWDGRHRELIRTVSHSLAGVSTMNRTAVKLRWQLPLKIVDDATFDQLQTLYGLAGPWWFWDHVDKHTDAPEPFAPSTATGWRIVLFEDLAETHHNPRRHSMVMTLLEV